MRYVLLNIVIGLLVSTSLYSEFLMDFSGDVTKYAGIYWVPAESAYIEIWDSSGAPVTALYTDEDGHFCDILVSPLFPITVRYSLGNWIAYDTLYGNENPELCSGIADNGFSTEVTLYNDTIPPGTPYISSVEPSGWTNVNSFTVSWYPLEVFPPGDPHSPGGSPVTHYQYRVEDGSPLDWTDTEDTSVTVTVNGSGIHSFYVRAVNMAGHGDSVEVQLKFDNTPPPVPTNIQAYTGWTNNKRPWVWNYTVVDEHSGVEEYKYFVIGGQPDTPTFLSDANTDSVRLPQSVSAEGVLYVMIQAVDSVGNESEFGDVTVKVDTSAPVIVHTPLGDTNAYGPRVVTADIDASLSGLLNAYVDINDGIPREMSQEEQGSGNFVDTIPEIDHDGLVEYRIVAVDSAGNIAYNPPSGWHSYYIDTQPPYIEDGQVLGGWGGDTVLFTIDETGYIVATVIDTGVGTDIFIPSAVKITEWGESDTVLILDFLDDGMHSDGGYGDSIYGTTLYIDSAIFEVGHAYDIWIEPKDLLDNSDIYNLEYPETNGPDFVVRPYGVLNLLAQDYPNDRGGKILLTWELSPDDNPPGAGAVTGYRIYRSTNPSDLGDAYGYGIRESFLIAEISSGIESYIDSGTTDGVTYYYSVTAIAGDIESEPSEVASAESRDNRFPRIIAIPHWNGGPPYESQAGGGSSNFTIPPFISLDWEPLENIGNADITYRIYRSEREKGGTPRAITELKNITEFRDFDIKLGRDYGYYISIFKDSKELCRSDYIELTTDVTGLLEDIGVNSVKLREVSTSVSNFNTVVSVNRQELSVSSVNRDELILPYKRRTERLDVSESNSISVSMEDGEYIQWIVFDGRESTKYEREFKIDISRDSEEWTNILDFSGENETGVWIVKLDDSDVGYVQVSGDIEAGDRLYIYGEKKEVSQGVMDNEAMGIPVRFFLSPAQPNPVISRSVIRYAVPERSRVRIALYDVTGRYLKTLVDGIKYPGWYEIMFDGRNLSQGVYFYRLETRKFTETRKVVLVK